MTPTGSDGPQPRHGEHPPTGSHCFFHWVGEQWLTASCPIEKLRDAPPVHCDAIAHFHRHTSVIAHSSDLEERPWHAKAALSDTCHSQQSCLSCHHTEGGSISWIACATPTP
ncbi:hypothetical protein ALMP_78160 [Streptomyces sp. A012304]|nr:hypothetical protein ALMP_78160 [Streptomyces sp. A012304]